MASRPSRQNGAVTRAIDYLPLLIPVRGAEVARFRRESRMRREPWASTPHWPWHRARLLRRVRFADANRLVYVHEARSLRYPGLIFGIGDDRRVEACLRHLGTPEIDMGSYRYSADGHRGSTPQRWGYVALRLPRRLPHMVLDARGTNSILGTSSLPLTFSREQVLSLEGDFNRHFTLYCPREYERDALTVFAPDLMALCIDESGSFDVEIVDDWMFLYRRGGLDIDSAAVLHRVFTIIDTVGTRLGRRAERYADERIGERRVDLIAPRGSRLRRATPAVSAGLLIAAIAAVIAVSRLGG